MGRKCTFLKTQIPYASLFALILTLGGFIALCVLAETIVQDWFKRIDRVIPIGHITTWWIIAIIGIIFGLWVVLLCFVGAIATTNISGTSSYLSEFGWQSNLARIGSYCSVAIFTLITYLATILWSIVLTIIGIVEAAHIVLIQSTNALCASGNANATIVNATDCVDLSILKPVIHLVTSTKPNVLFCDEKLFEFCSVGHDVTVTAIICYVLGVIVMIGWLHFLMSTVANWTRYRFLQSKFDFNPDRYNQRSGKYSVTVIGLETNGKSMSSNF